MTRRDPPPLRERLREAWMEHVLLPVNVTHLRGPKRIDYQKDELIVVCLEKDAEQHIAPFIEHYTQMGVKHIVFLDNGSRDRTVAVASRYPNVSVFRTTLPFRGNNCAMRRYLLRRFGRRRRWVLCVDVDELFDFPYSDRIGLASLLRYLRSRSYTAMVAYLLDMLSDRPLSDHSRSGAPLEEAYPFYDVSEVRKEPYFEEDGYGGQAFVRHNTISNPAVARYVGGIRARAFDLPYVYLIKHPLMYLDGRVRLTHQHFVDHASVADVTGVLYHYKFVEGFAAKVDAAVRSRKYADDSFEYRHYQRALAENPQLCLKTERARRFAGVNELIGLDFLQVTTAYERWVSGQGGAN